MLLLPLNSRVRKNLVRTIVYKGHFVVCNKFVTTFRVLNLYRMGVCEEHAHSHSIVAGGLLEMS
jgi:hypothetical protein